MMIFSLKQARLIKGLTQKEVAEKLGVNRDTYRRLEKYPDETTIKQAKQLSEILDMSYDFIFFNDNSTFSRYESRDSTS
ncbi:helix-turn-helix transcriptional regulator [Niallia circulans]|uniref:helix-turn-helix transcriptional regulator n=1 Tax=Niallia circulans TaxID=1397 RepID=UPI002E1EFF04|nr:helix-turn-helix transcriptional regulator [Niallia circulans]